MRYGKFIFIVLSVLLFSEFVFALSEEQQKISECRVGCNDQKKFAIRQCYESYSVCSAGCSGLLDCRQECYWRKMQCFREKVSLFSECSKNCKYSALNFSLDCEGGYKPGQVFLKGCEKCLCNFDGKIKCEKTSFCNFDNLSLSREKCVGAGGLFQPLCNGPHFDLVCTVDSYCICGGRGNFTCPQDFVCVRDFISPNKRKAQTISGWKTQLGQSLGIIGVCAQKPILLKCGDGVCDNLVVKGDSVAETKYNCPEDCH